MLKRLADATWETSQPLRLFGLMEIGHRMTVFRLRDGSLLLHSPVAHERSIEDELAALGSIGHVVAPSLFHDLHLGEWRGAIPHATFWAAPELAAKRPELSARDLPESGSVAEWGEELELHSLDGMPRVRERVMLHRPSRTLAVADLVFNLGRATDFSTRVLLRMNGAHARTTPSRLFKFMIRDRDAFRASLESILEQDFDRLVMGHGDVIETDGRRVLREAFSWL